MSDLSLGGGTLPEYWSYPSPVYIGGEYRSEGMVWMGDNRVTERQLEELYEALDIEWGTPDVVDQGTVVGRLHPLWLPFSDKAVYLRGGTPSRAGGIGSDYYELQHVGGGDGARFRKESEGDMWYVDTSGNMVYGIPPNNAGCYHRKYVGDGYYDNVEGVEQGSKADQILGKGEFYWDEKRRLYNVR